MTEIEPCDWSEMTPDMLLAHMAGLAILQKKIAKALDGAKRQYLRCFASMFVRQVRQCFSVVWADGFPRCRHRFPVM